MGKLRRQHDLSLLGLHPALAFSPLCQTAPYISDALPACQLVQIAALHIKVAGFLSLSLADAAHIPHFGKRGKVLEVVGLIYKEPVHTQLLESHNVVLAALVVELIELA